MNLSSLMPHLIYQFKSESDLIKAIEEISLKFTRERNKIGDYLKDPRLVSAYTVFYLLTNIPKLEEVLKWMPQEWIDALKKCDFIDLGAGPGTFSLAWKSLGASGIFHQIELSSLMKEQGKKIWQGLYSEDLKQGSRWEWNSNNEKFVLFGHSANEMGVKNAIDYIEKINPDHILFIEPGMKEFFPKMLEIRDYLLKNNWNVLYPCPLALECPLKNSSEDWCHQFIQVKQDAEIERISQMARKDRKLLPLTVHAYSKTFKSQNPSERLVRVLPETKFSLEWEVCQDNKLVQDQVMKRDLTKQETRELSEVLAGASIETEVVKTLERSNRVKVLSVAKKS
jgi:ribosomal protein RSM22 (predicted rRNA methylase)